MQLKFRDYWHLGLQCHKNCPFSSINSTIFWSVSFSQTDFFHKAGNLVASSSYFLYLWPSFATRKGLNFFSKIQFNTCQGKADWLTLGYTGCGKRQKPIFGNSQGNYLVIMCEGGIIPFFEGLLWVTNKNSSVVPCLHYCCYFSMSVKRIVSSVYV